MVRRDPHRRRRDRDARLYDPQPIARPRRSVTRFYFAALPQNTKPVDQRGRGIFSERVDDTDRKCVDDRRAILAARDAHAHESFVAGQTESRERLRVIQAQSCDEREHSAKRCAAEKMSR